MDNVFFYVRRLKTRFSIHPRSIYLFVSGSFLGFVVSILFPSTGGYYFNLYASDVASFALGLQSGLGTVGAVLAITLKNLIPVSALTFLPYVLVVYHEKLGFKTHNGGFFESLKTSLKLISLCPIFTYGFAVYGLFLGHLYTSFSPATASRFLLTSMIHGWLEILVMLAAGSTGLIFVDTIASRREEFKTYINFKAVFNRWLWLVAGVLIASLVETFVSPLFI